jgi:hypothetical protein
MFPLCSTRWWALADRIYELDDGGRLTELPAPPRAEVQLRQQAS